MDDDSDFGGARGGADASASDPGGPGSGAAPDRPGLPGFLAGLGVERNAAVGAVVGLLAAALIYAVRVFELLGPAPAGAGGPGLFLALAFVLAVGTALLVTVALTGLAAYREVQEL
jgi:hypothetical protein